MTSENMLNATSSLVSEDGQSPCDSRCGQTIDLFGQEVAPVSPLVLPAREAANRMSATYGHIGQWLIGECRPSIIFGEQVAAAITAGWLDDVFYDLEKENYACASAVLPACSITSPHRRERAFFVADSNGDEYISERREGNRETPIMEALDRQENGSTWEFGRTGNEYIVMGNSKREGLERHAGNEETIWRSGQNGSIASPDTEWVRCPDGKYRPIKSGIHMLADGVPARVGKLRAYGNAIVPQVAAEFIKAYMECRP